MMDDFSSFDDVICYPAIKEKQLTLLNVLLLQLGLPFPGLIIVYKYKSIFCYYRTVKLV